MFYIFEKIGISADIPEDQISKSVLLVKSSYWSRSNENDETKHKQLTAKFVIKSRKSPFYRSALLCRWVQSP